MILPFVYKRILPRQMRLSTFLLSFLMFFALAETLYAATLTQGIGHYRRGDFTSCQNDLRKFLSQKDLFKRDQAEGFKYLGICQFMLQNPSEASRSFSKAMQINPSTKIRPDEVLDESVIALFEKSKSSANTNRGSSRSGGSGGETLLLVESNATGASILIDGILAGKVGSPIRTKPGAIEFQVSGNGFRPRQVKTVVKQNTTNTLRVDLVNIAELRQKQQAAAAAAQLKKRQELQQRQNAQKAAQQRAEQQQQAQKVRSAPQKNPDPLGFGDAESMASAKAPGSTNEAPKNLILPVPREGGLSSSGPAPQRDLSAEFQAESAGRPAPPPNYPTPPVYGPVGPFPPQAYPMYPPGYAPPPVQIYTQPAPAFYPPQPVYQDPLANPSPYVDPLAAAPQQPAAQAVQAPAPTINKLPDDIYRPKRSNSKKASQRKVPAKNSGTRVFMALLPFGIGQLYDSKPLLGLTFMGAQAGALYGYYYQSQVIAEQQRLFTEFQEENTDPIEIDEYRETSLKQIETATNYQNYALMAFGGLWALSTLESFLNPPMVDAPKRSTRRRPRFTLNLDLLNGPNRGFENIYDINSAQFLKTAFPLPPVGKKIAEGTPGVTLGVEWKY